MLEVSYSRGWEFALEKVGGVGTEIAGTLFNPMSLPIAAPALIAGAILGEKDKHKEGVNKATLSNLVLPGVAPFRLGKRINSKLKD